MQQFHVNITLGIGQIANLKTFFNFILIWLWVTVGVSRNEHLREIEEAAEEVLSDKQEPRNIIIPVYK